MEAWVFAGRDSHNLLYHRMGAINHMVDCHYCYYAIRDHIDLNGVSDDINPYFNRPIAELPLNTSSSEQTSPASVQNPKYCQTILLASGSGCSCSS